MDRQTADTFQAAAAFLDLCQIWGPLEPEIASKVKFAKYHSLRILKAIKAGEDPNLSNPVPEADEEPPLDPNDPEVQMLNGSSEANQHQNTFRQPTVVEVPDEHDHLKGPLAERSTYDESLHPSRAPSVAPQASRNHQQAQNQSEETFYQIAPAPDVSPIAPTSAQMAMSDSGGYFPTVPNDLKRAPGAASSNLPPHEPVSPPEVILPDPSSLPPPGASGFRTSRPPTNGSLHSFPPPVVDDTNFSPPPSAALPTYPLAPPAASVPPTHSEASAAPRQTPQTPIQPPLPTPSAPVRHEAPARALASPSIASQPNYSMDEESILKAQKHARWAISALNFEDVNTAVKELKGALESLNAN